jgi:hypothetical protein
VTFPNGDDSYVVLFDDRLRPIQVEGPVDLTPIGRGRLVARQDDFRPVDGRWLPHHVVYTLDGDVLADERVVAACVGAERLLDETFRHPARLPPCGRPDDPHARPATPARHRVGASARMEVVTPG